MIKRHILETIKESLKFFPVVLIVGARQVGKSTLAKELCKEGIFDEYITLDDLSVLDSAKSAPESFIKQFKGSIVIDEIQRVPDLLIAIKKVVDENKIPGKFLLTGSANLLSSSEVKESLAGRMDIINVFGLSCIEMTQELQTFNIINEIIDDDNQTILTKFNSYLKEKSPLSKEKLNEAIFYGGYPDVALKKNANFKNRWFSAYQAAYIERDARDIKRSLDVLAFSKVYKLAGLNTGNLLNIKNLSVDIGLDQRTVARYLEILEYTFQINLLQPWYSNIKKRMVKTPKLYANDSGLACFLAGIKNPNELNNHPYYGALLETWFLSEINKLLATTTNIDKFFYRTHQGKEIDLILTQGDKLIGIECKASDRVSHSDLSALNELSLTLGNKFKGTVFYSGEKAIALQNNLIALPFNILF